MIEKLRTIDSSLVPKRKLHTGDKMPAIGFGTFGSDNYSSDEVSTAVKFAIKTGFKHINCASVYMNQKEIGKAITELINENQIVREDIWISSKVWNDMHGQGDVIAACKQSLEDLQLDYLDLCLIHWPFPNYHAPGCDVDSRNSNSKPYNHEDYMVAWCQLEQLVEMGLVRNIGTSNMTIPKMELLLRDATIKPSVNEMELHPHFQQPELFNFLVERDIVPVGYSPIGSPKRPERDRTNADTVDIEDPVIVKIANRLNVHPAEVCIKWAIQRGQVPIPFSVKPDKIYSNLRAVVQDLLTEQDMNELSKIDKNCRLIKGQVFLWEKAEGWEDLWDLDGKIAH